MASPLQLKTLDDLPETVIINNILPCLPIADAGRTSVLGRSWRDRWRSVPELNFIFSGEDYQLDVAAVDQVLLHSGHPIHHFLLSKRLPANNGPFPQIYRWLAALARNSDHLRSLTLRFDSSELFQLCHIM